MENNEELIYNIINDEIYNRENIIQDSIIENEEKLNYRNEYYKIKEYLDDFLNGNVINRFLVLPGLRATGKTTILYQLYDYLINNQNINKNQVLFLSGELINEYADFNILNTVELFIKRFHNKSLLSLDKNLFIFIDEAHYDDKWSLAGKIIFDKSKKVFTIFTGSSALNFETNIDSVRRLLKIPINPLNFNQHLFLKYRLKLENTQNIENMIFTGEIEKAKNSELNIKSQLINSRKYDDNEWYEYLKYGGFPFFFNEKSHYEICEKINEMVKKIITNDLFLFNNLSSNTMLTSIRLLRVLALQKPGEVSKNKLSNILDCSSSTIQELLYNLEKSYLLFHVEPFSSSSKRIRKSWKYYFATASLKNNLAKKYGNTYNNINAYYGLLSENLVATTFNRLSKRGNFDLYFDSEKNGVDFIIHTSEGKTIPIEVRYGKKTKKQIGKAISKYNSDYGIVISNTTETIKKDENVIYLPLKTFSFI